MNNTATPQGNEESSQGSARGSNPEKKRIAAVTSKHF